MKLLAIAAADAFPRRQGLLLVALAIPDVLQMPKHACSCQQQATLCRAVGCTFWCQMLAFQAPGGVEKIRRQRLYLRMGEIVVLRQDLPGMAALRVPHSKRHLAVKA